MPGSAERLQRTVSSRAVPMFPEKCRGWRDQLHCSSQYQPKKLLQYFFNYWSFFFSLFKIKIPALETSQNKARVFCKQRRDLNCIF